jgi:hypothetical protein
MEYPVCNVYYHAVKKYRMTRPINRLSKEYSLDYRKLKDYVNNTFIKLDLNFIDVLCDIFGCEFNEMLVDDKEEYYKVRSPKDGQVKTVSGLVYFVRNTEGLTKIGRTYNLKNRLLRLKHEPRGEGATLIHYIESSDINVLEKTLHQAFASKRVQGEWFNLSDEDIAYFK